MSLLNIGIFLFCIYILIEVSIASFSFLKPKEKPKVHQELKLDIERIKGEKGKDLNLVIEKMFSRN